MTFRVRCWSQPCLTLPSACGWLNCFWVLCVLLVQLCPCATAGESLRTLYDHSYKLYKATTLCPEGIWRMQMNRIRWRLLSPCNAGTNRAQAKLSGCIPSQPPPYVCCRSTAIRGDERENFAEMAACGPMTHHIKCKGPKKEGAPLFTTPLFLEELLQCLSHEAAAHVRPACSSTAGLGTAARPGIDTQTEVCPLRTS